jgi:hypothetical protein
MQPLVTLPHLASLSVDPDDAWIPSIAESCRMYCRDTTDSATARSSACAVVTPEQT